MRVLVTGAAGGIGSAVVSNLAGRGAEVVAQDIAPVDPPGGASQVVTSNGDLLDPAYLERLKAEVGGPLDAVVTAHGAGYSDALVRLTDADIDQLVQVNFLTIPRLYGCFADELASAEGTFLGIASQAGLLGVGDATSYSGSKAAMIGWLASMAAPAARRGIRLRALCPGPVDTPLLQTRMVERAQATGVSPEEWIRRRVAPVMARRLARTDEIAEFIGALLDLRSPGPVIVPMTGGEVLHTPARG